MQQYQVPQFIAIEDRVIGPFTIRQFLYLLAAAGAGLLGWFFLHVVLFVLVAVPLAALFLAMAFVKISERPLATVLASAINYYLRPRRYLWRQAPPKPASAQALPGPGAGEVPSSAVPSLTERKIEELAWSLDIPHGRGEE